MKASALSTAFDLLDVFYGHFFFENDGSPESIAAASLALAEVQEEYGINTHVSKALYRRIGAFTDPAVDDKDCHREQMAAVIAALAILVAQRVEYTEEHADDPPTPSAEELRAHFELGTEES